MQCSVVSDIQYEKLVKVKWRFTFIHGENVGFVCTRGDLIPSTSRFMTSWYRLIVQGKQERK